MPHEVIMPALGMAQDTGVLVAWHKKPGDPVSRGDILMEVETDKATMEVEAGADGFVTELRAEAGANVPVGDVIAVIGETADAVAEKPAKKADQSYEPAPQEAAKQPQVAPAEPKPATPSKAAPPATNGRILASPKAKRIAAEQGLDLSRLVAEGVAQPYHVADLETLRALPAPGASSRAVATAAMHLSASVPAEGLESFRAWLTEEAGKPVPASAILAGLATGALRSGQKDRSVELGVAVEDPVGGQAVYSDADIAGLANCEPAADIEPALLIRDLTSTRLTGMRLGAEALPVITITRNGDHLSIALEAAPDALPAEAAIALLSEFAARLETPLRQLL